MFISFNSSLATSSFLGEIRHGFSATETPSNSDDGNIESIDTHEINLIEAGAQTPVPGSMRQSFFQPTINS